MLRQNETGSIETGNIGMFFARLFLAVLLFCAPVAALAQDPLSALARLLPGGISLSSAGQGGFALDMALSQPVPYRLRLVDDPPRLVVDFQEVDFGSLSTFDPTARPGRPEAVAGLRHGPLQPGWSRLVVDLTGPYGIDSAAMSADAATGRAYLRLVLSPIDGAEFAARAVVESALFEALPQGGLPARPLIRPEGAPLMVVLDPGHGGIDPGAERDGLREADLMLGFARELRDLLRRAGGFEVVLTRDDDIFVSLEGRIRIAREVGADVFLSLHADALPDGGATGATIYTLAAEASDAAAAALAERHDRDDLLAGVDLTDQDDLIATVLMSIARTETVPRTDALADHLVSVLRENDLRMHRRPRQAAGFSVLKAPDIPSILIELGFMSSPRDLADLQDPVWRARMAASIVQALERWVADEAASAGLRRR